MSIQVKDALGATQTIETPAAAGRAAAAASKPTAMATEDFAAVGALTETAPASDTASSGLNGRLQRIAQRVSSMIALLPTALGAGGGLKVDGSGTALPVSGTVTANAGSGTQAVSLASVPSHAVTNVGTFATQSAITAAASAIADGADATIGAKADAKSTATDTTPITAMSVWKQVSASVQSLVTAAGNALTRGAGASDSNTARVTIDSGQLAALQTTQPAMATPGSQSVILPSDMPWPKGLSNRAFSVAFATLTRPANVTAYSAADSISDNATAGSVTALVSGNISDVNNDPMFISEIAINSTDTGLAGKKIRAYLFNSDPTAASGVGAGDNAAYLQKKAGYIGSFMGWMETGFSDGTVGRLVPAFNETNNSQAGGFIVVPPVSGARTLYIQYQAVEAFTPSANSTTIIGTAKGWQGRAA